ncbi:hypothetical protein pb186bvf_013388 [Paramecium bursaria]
MYIRLQGIFIIISYLALYSNGKEAAKIEKIHCGIKTLLKTEYKSILPFCLYQDVNQISYLQDYKILSEADVWDQLIQIQEKKSFNLYDVVEEQHVTDRLLQAVFPQLAFIESDIIVEYEIQSYNVQIESNVAVNITFKIFLYQRKNDKDVFYTSFQAHLQFQLDFIINQFGFTLEYNKSELKTQEEDQTLVNVSQLHQLNKILAPYFQSIYNHKAYMNSFKWRKSDKFQIHIVDKFLIISL